MCIPNEEAQGFQRLLDLPEYDVAALAEKTGKEYTDPDTLKDEGEDAEDFTRCEPSKTAIVVYGEGAGTTRTVCTDPNCPVHHPRRVVAPDPEAEARQREFEKEQAQRKRLLKRRTESFNRILDNAPTSFTAPQLRALLPALIHIDSYDFADDVAAHFVGDDENNQQSADKVLLLPEPYSVMVFIEQCTGLRVDELLALRWAVVHFERLFMEVKEGAVHSRVGPVKTECSEAEFPLDPEFATILLEWKRKSIRSDLMFPGHITGVWSPVRIAEPGRASGAKA
jgi:hypothetical protein